VRGEQHLAAAGSGVILPGFHLGPSGSYLALRVLGHRLTWFGGRGASGGWSREIQDRYQSRSGDLFISETEPWRVPLLYRARQILLEGGTIFISADGIGREALSVPLPSAPPSSRPAG